MNLDQYVLQARVAPLAVALLPFGILAGLVGLPGTPVLAAAVAVVGPTLLALVGADVVRSLGRDLECRLWHDLGGSPTTLAFLADDETGADRRRRLEIVTGLRVGTHRPSVERAASALRDLASDSQRFPRIPIANANYGRARHLLALRPHAMAIAVVADVLLACLLTPLPMPESVVSLPMSQTLPAAMLCGAATAFWSLFPSEHCLRRAADDYADRLLAALDVLSGQDTARR